MVCSKSFDYHCTKVSHTKTLATPEVMAFGKEKNPLKLHKRLLGTSNSLVWGIDEYANTHHFFHI